MTCMRMADGKRINVILNGKFLEELGHSIYLGPYTAVNAGINGEMEFKMNKTINLCGGMKKCV